MGLRFIVILGLVALGIMVVLSLPDNKVRVIVCDVGQGDGVLITKGYSQWVIDTGGANGKFLGCLQRHMAFWDRAIDTVIISHWDGDHSGGLSQVLSYYKISNIYSGTEPSGVFEHISYSGNIARGDILSMGLINFEVKSPSAYEGDENMSSLVGLLSYKDMRFLLMGDVPAEREQKLVWRDEIGKAGWLKVSHHGSAGATSRELLEKVKPREAIISVGKENTFGHPSESVIERLKEMGIGVRRTDVEGEIILEW